MPSGSVAASVSRCSTTRLAAARSDSLAAPCARGESAGASTIDVASACAARNRMCIEDLGAGWTLQCPVRPGTPDRHGHALLLPGIACRAHDVEEEGATVGAEARSRELGSVQPIAREVEDAAVTREAANELFPD